MEWSRRTRIARDPKGEKKHRIMECIDDTDVAAGCAASCADAIAEINGLTPACVPASPLPVVADSLFMSLAPEVLDRAGQIASHGARHHAGAMAIEDGRTPDWLDPASPSELDTDAGGYGNFDIV